MFRLRPIRPDAHPARTTATGSCRTCSGDYGGAVWDKDGKPALGTSFLKENTAALQFAVDTIQKHKIQPPGVMGCTDVSNNAAVTVALA